MCVCVIGERPLPLTRSDEDCVNWGWWWDVETVASGINWHVRRGKRIIDKVKRIKEEKVSWRLSCAWFELERCLDWTIFYKFCA